MTKIPTINRDISAISAVEIDKRNIWHPFTQERTSNRNIKITHAVDEFLFDADGKRYVDLISSWWTIIHGHCNKKIIKAVENQIKILDHVMFAGITHAPAQELCAKLLSVLPASLCKFFFSDNGSCAVEVAMKMAYQFWHNQGTRERTTFLNFEGGYHGDTFGAMSVGCKSGYHDVFSDFFFKSKTFQYPYNYIGNADIDEIERAELDKLTDYLDLHNREVIALIIEPLIQGAAGMKMCRPSFIDEVVRICRNFNVLVIFDEVMTGFFRTGKFFAMDHMETKPDFLCVSKGLTGGILPLSLTITTGKIYEKFCTNDAHNCFMHGHTYSGNPIACAAANASFDLLISENVASNIADIQEVNHAFALHLSENYTKNPEVVSKVRVMGGVVGFSLRSTTDADALQSLLMDDGIFVRPISTQMYVIPPYCIGEKNLQKIYNNILQKIKKIN